MKFLQQVLHGRFFQKPKGASIKGPSHGYQDIKLVESAATGNPPGGKPVHFAKKTVIHAPEKANGKLGPKSGNFGCLCGQDPFPTDPKAEQKETEKQEKAAQPL